MEFSVKITITGRHLEITPAIRQYAEEKSARLTKHLDNIVDANIILDGATDKTKKVEIVVSADHNRFVASSDGADLYGCIDQVIHKLERQLTDHKERSRNHKHNA